jgi:cytochrome c553
MKYLTAIAVIGGMLLAATAMAAETKEAPATPKADPAKAQAIASGVCSACHGVDGNSPLPANPSLAGQHPEYIYKQLLNFKSGERKNPVMSAMVAPLSQDDMRNLAAYYSSQKPRQGAAQDAKLVAAGQKLYRGGDAATGVAACAGCHSPDGSGIPAQYPRLKGQSVEYTVAQLKAFRAGERANDSAMMMRTIAGRLTDNQMDAIAEYVSALK